MDTQEAIKKRWGCRKYLDKPLEKEKVGTILDAGRFAPSAGNLQDRCFIVVNDEKKKESIAQACGNQIWMQSAAVFIVVVSENKKLTKFFGERSDKIYSIQDTAFAIENMLLAATDIGLGCSLVVGINEEKINEILSIPAPAKIHAIITLGYAAEPEKQSTKYPLENFVFFEKYGERIENPAAAYGDWSTAREKYIAEQAKNVKKESKNLLTWVKSLFNKKKEPKEDHFMEKIETPIKEIKREDEIPRVLPR